MNKIEAPLNHPRFKKQHIVRNKDGSVYYVYLFYVVEEYAQRHVSKFDGDLEKAVAWAVTKYITYPQDVVALGPILYEETRESFLKQATLLVKSYDDPNRIFDKQNDHTFKIEFTDAFAESKDEINKCTTILADRFEVAIALWNFSAGSGHLIDRVTELKGDKIVNVWEAPDTSTYERDELKLVFSA